LQLQRQNTKASNHRAGEDNHPRNQNQPPQFHYCRDPNITLLLINPEKARTLTLQAIDAQRFMGGPSSRMAHFSAVKRRLRESCQNHGQQDYLTKIEQGM